MPKYIISSDGIKLLYKQLKSETNNFTEITPDVLVVEPRKILIFRLILGLSQNEFEKLIEKRSKNIAKYETGKIKTMQLSTAVHIIKKIKNSVRPVDLDTVIENFRKLKEESFGWFKFHSNAESVLNARRKGAIESLRKRRTSQERLLEEELKIRNIKFHVNFPLTDSMIVDFYLPQKNIVIECKELISNSRRETKEQIQKLAYQGYRIKFKFPEKKLWGLLKTKVNIQPFTTQELKGPFDVIFNDIKILIKDL